ncbi:Beta-1,3-glucosyltransferase [Nymphon striatum]|nr:Beta-1,3-glucosyltransferase [Nymphon striatum]
MVDARGLHPLSCKYSTERLPRHSAINNIVERALGVAGFPSQLEPLRLDCSDTKLESPCQSNPYHVGKAEENQQHIRQQYAEFDKKSDIPIIQLSHQDYDVTGSWTIIPILHRIRFNDVKWVFLCEDVTRINLKMLLKVLRNYSYDQEWFLGHALRDQEATIIHHFAFHEDPMKFSYPSFASGFAFSNGLLARLLSEQTRKPKLNQFSIDPKHELAMYIKDSTGGVELTHVPEFCLAINYSQNCASYISETFPSCPSKSSEDFVVAVKTYSKFYDTRVQVTQNTWAPFVQNLIYFGDVENSTIPVKSLGIPNTKAGHCAKTIAIMKYFLLNLLKHRWLVIVDDDTIFSISRMKQLLNCYDSSNHLALGERYGFQTSSSTGYDYITGGGGSATVKKLIENDECKCPNNDSPDDMILGMCLKRLNLPVTHSAAFHQARPNDYSHEYLASHLPLSFHKHWLIDPIEVYNSWFRKEDEKMIVHKNMKHNEL